MSSRMWTLLMIVSLLDHNQAVPLPGQRGGLQLLLQDQVDQTTPSATPATPQQKNPSSSSSSSSASSESSQRSEGRQELRQPENLENTAVEQVDSSQESLELRPFPSSTSSLWLHELVLLGQRVGEQDGERDTRDDSVEDRHRAMFFNFHHLLSRPQHREAGLPAEVGGATSERGGAKWEVGAAAGEEGSVREEKFDADFPQLSDNSTEEADKLTFDLPGNDCHHGYNRDEAGLELGL